MMTSHTRGKKTRAPFTLENQTILVCGASGLSGSYAASLGLSLFANVLLSDQNPTHHPKFHQLLSSPRVQDLRPRQDAKILKEHQIDAIIVSPGLDPNIDILTVAHAKGIPIYAENDFGYYYLLERYKRENRGKPYIIAITGTDGKSTTTALLCELINKSTHLKAVACGNFGRPLSEIALDPLLYDILVVECSSFQLERLTYFHPHTSLLLNLSNDHRERYNNQEAYFEAKANICRKQTIDDLLIVSTDLQEYLIKHLHKTKNTTNSPRLLPLELKTNMGTKEGDEIFHWGSEMLIKAKDLALVGKHNYHNILFSLAALKELESRLSVHIHLELLKKNLRDFRGLPHRLEYIGALNLCQENRHYALSCYNDSKATTLQAVKAALESFPQNHVFLLCGGRLKKESHFSYLKQVQVTAFFQLDIFPFGEAGASIHQQIQGETFPFSHKLHPPSPHLKSGFELAKNIAESYTKDLASAQTTKQKGLILLLSPGCASFDAYQNYLQRGKHFLQLVQEYGKDHKNS